MSPKSKHAKVRHKLTDGYVASLVDFAEGERRVVWDTEIREFRVTVGKHRTSFSFFAQHRIHGNRSATVRHIGHFPVMSAVKARQEAKAIAGRIAAGRVDPSKRKAVKFADAFAEYKIHLAAKAAKAGKPARWLRNVTSYGDNLLLPAFGRWPLSDLSNDPAAVRDWHVKATKRNGPVTANRAAQVLRATYRYASRLNRSLPPALPTSAVVMNSESARETGVDDFRAWAAAWKKIPSKNRAAFVLCNLLTGCRPSELGALRWDSINVRARVIVIGKSKTGIDIRVPMSWPIAACLRMAREHRGERSREVDKHKAADNAAVFPSARQNPTRDGLPAYGNSLRHAWRTVAADLKTDDLLAHCLLGHAPRGVSAGYISRISLSMWPAMRAAQRDISGELIKRLRLKPGDLR